MGLRVNLVLRDMPSFRVLALPGGRSVGPQEDVDAGRHRRWTASCQY